MKEAKEEEEIFHLEVDTVVISEVRKKIPVFMDRRYSNYQLY